MRTLRCWWFGCEREPDDSTPHDYVRCKRCGECIDYSDLVGDTRHKQFMDGFYGAFRTVIPKKCSQCARRWRKCDDAVFHDDIPF